jgi:rod shape-determining protein MreD
MRWLLVAILGYAALVTQMTLFRRGCLALEMDGHWVRPDLILLLGIFLALYLDPRDMFVPAWCLGMAMDLVGIDGRLGLWAILFAVALTVLSAARRHVARGRAMVQLVLALVVAGGVHLGWYLTARLLVGAPLAPLESLGDAAADAAYTAFLAPCVFWLLARLRSPLHLAMDIDEA